MRTRFLTSLRPAYAALERVVGDAREYAANVKGKLRIGFQGAANDTAVVKILNKKTPDGEPYEATLVEEDATQLVIRAVERESGLARTLRLPRSWPWAEALAVAFTRLAALPPPAH